MPKPTADLLAEAVEALLKEWRRRDIGDVHYHGNAEPCGHFCPIWTRNAAEVALARWRNESKEKK